MRRPDNIAFGVDDPLPARLGAGLALQQLAFLGALLVIPEIYVRAQGLGHHDFLNIVSSTLLVSAFVILLQVRGMRHLGARYYYPLQATGAVLPAMYLVSSLPGATLATVFGMVWVIGLSQVAFSFLIMRLRNVFTVEVSGVAVMLIGLGLGHLGFREIFGHGTDGTPASGASLLVGLLTFATMVACNVWVKTVLRLFAPLLAVASGAEVHLDKAPVSTDPAALQNGAKLFVNYCLNCHGASYMRYNRLQQIGLSEQMIKDNGFSCKPEFRAFSGYPIIKSSLDAGNIDVFAMDRSTLAGYMNETVELLQPEVKFGEQGYGVATKKGCDLSAVVDQVICDRLADGWLDQEVKTWGLV